MAAALLSFVFGDHVEGFAIVAFIIINALIGFVTELRGVRSIEALRKLGTVSSRVRRNGTVAEIPAQELVPGDVVLLEGGDIITADLRILEASRLQADESALTGESVPVGKGVEQLPEEVVLADDVDIEITNEAKLALARVLYELEDFDRAYRYYREIEAQEVNLSDVIFEEAWAKYRQGDYKKAMGRLVAFSAPSFQGLFQPEQYILQALIYMQYCHYNAAQETVISFLERYGFLLERIHHSYFVFLSFNE